MKTKLSRNFYSFWLSWLYFISFAKQISFYYIFISFSSFFCFTFDKAGELLPVWQRHDIKKHIYRASECYTMLVRLHNIYILKILTWLNVTWWIYSFFFTSPQFRSFVPFHLAHLHLPFVFLTLEYSCR